MSLTGFCRKRRQFETGKLTQNIYIPLLTEVNTSCKILNNLLDTYRHGKVCYYFEPAVKMVNDKMIGLF